MPQPTFFRLADLSHGILYCIASLVLGIELNIVGPTADSLAAQVGVTEAALGGVVGLGGVGLLVGGLPSGWLLDRLPGHTVLTGALALQAAAFLLLPHCTHLVVLAATYCAAALTFNAITTGANALILWRYPASQGAWLNLASALFGVGCFLAPVLANLASRAGGGNGGDGGGGGGQHGDGDGSDAQGSGDGDGVARIGPFSLHGGPAALAYYLVAAGAAACCIWAASLPSPTRPDPHHHHHHHETAAEGAALNGNEDDGDGNREFPYIAPLAPGRKNQGRAAATIEVGGGGSGGSSSAALLSSPSFASVLNMGGLESPAASLGSRRLGAFSEASSSDGAVTAVAAGPPGAAAAAGTVVMTEGCAVWGTSSTTSPSDIAASAAASPKTLLPPPPSVTFAGADGGSAVVHLPIPTSAQLPLPPVIMCDGNGCGGGGCDSASGTDCGFGSALSTSPSTWDETGSGIQDQNCRTQGENPLLGGGAAAGPGDPNLMTPDAASDILSAAAAQIVQLQRQQHKSDHQPLRLRQEEDAVTVVPTAPPAGWCRGRGNGAAAGPGPLEEERMDRQVRRAGGSATPALVAPQPYMSPTAALFRRYLHELRMGWPVLLPVVLLLFANISTQASFGAWVTTYCQRAVGLDEAAAHAVTAAYWAAFTGTRMAAVAAAPFLHASRVLLVTSPFAVAGAGMAVLGLPKIPGLFPPASSTAAAASATTGGAAAFAAGLPL